MLDENKSIADGLFAHNKAIGYYGDPSGQHMAILKKIGTEHGFSLGSPFKELSEVQKDILFHGTGQKYGRLPGNTKRKHVQAPKT